ncbi:hypothetical protein QC763_0069010 [Podospora pseudopauciseta]|uniref:Uncharacterized protein n=1 Tax=Podospora pseudopauciseta TaxID=2093780 RepID=A0ABR0HDZ6_9PEZI|nr:hypothetical protein QC763_0069010 [Podospora pseudopauciseta]
MLPVAWLSGTAMSQHEVKALHSHQSQGTPPSDDIVKSSSDPKRSWPRLLRSFPIPPCSSSSTIATESFWSNRGDDTNSSRASSPEFLFSPRVQPIDILRNKTPFAQHCTDSMPTTRKVAAFGRGSCVWTSDMVKPDEKQFLSELGPVEVNLPSRLSAACEDSRVRGEDTSNHDRLPQKLSETSVVDEPRLEGCDMEYRGTYDTSTLNSGNSSDCDCSETDDGFWKWNESRERFIHTDESTGREIVCPQWFD